MQHHQSPSMLDLLIDDELTGDERRETERHIQNCAACAADLERRRALRAAVRSGVPYYRASSALEGRVRTAIREAARQPAGAARPAFSRPRSWWWAMAAGLVLVAGGSGTTGYLLSSRAGGNDAVLEQELFSSHIRSLMPDHLTDVISTDQHTVKPWFNGRLDFSPPVVDLSNSGFPLVGGRLDYLGGRPVAALVYGRRRHYISLYIWPSSSATGVQPASGTQDGYHLLHWKLDGMSYTAISDVSADDITTFARLIREQLGPSH
ncbi:MAG: anti-sigma factor [Gemmatimonadota bacterium]